MLTPKPMTEYKQLDITPDKPGPQVSHKRSSRKRTNPGKEKKRAHRRLSSQDDDETESDFEGESTVGTPIKRTKRLKPNVGRCVCPDIWSLLSKHLAMPHKS